MAAKYPYSTEIFRKYYEIAKIYRKLPLTLLKYFNNVTMPAQNVTYAIFFKYSQNWRMHKHCFFGTRKNGPWEKRFPKKWSPGKMVPGKMSFKN